MDLVCFVVRNPLF